MAEAFLTLIDLNSHESFDFYFPKEIKTNNRANWQPQDISIGVQPLFYANRSPGTISFTELYYDNTITDPGRDLTKTLAHLKSVLLDEQEQTGTPPAILATWGDRAERCVVTDLTVEEIFFSDAGNPMRARVAIELLEVQKDSEGTGVIGH